MAIIGAHMLLYTPEADAVRDVLKDSVGFDYVDTGDNWLIFALPPSELGVHPAEAPAHEVSFVCDDLALTMQELTAKGVMFRGEPSNEGWGLVVTMILPGEVEVTLYEPFHPTAFETEE